MRRITPFAFPVLEELMKRKNLRASFLTAFPGAAEHIGEKGILDRKLAIKALSGTAWVGWVEHVWAEMEDFSRVVAQFGPLAQDYEDRIAEYAPDVDKESAQKRADEKRSQMEIQGPKIWRWLHSMALGWDGDAESLQTILSLITNAVPCGECKKHWVEMLTAHPPKAKNAEELFAESVAWHNQVNVRLGKPQLSVEDARKIYSPAG
jgi:hypothetical protein